MDIGALNESVIETSFPDYSWGAIDDDEVKQLGEH
jgi:hypothetical protein